MYSDNRKSQGSVATHLRYGGLALPENYIIGLIAGEKNFKIGTLLAKLQAK